LCFTRPTTLGRSGRGINPWYSDILQELSQVTRSEVLVL